MGTRGHPGGGPHLWRKEAPRLLPTLTRYKVFTYISSTILQNLGPSPAMTIFLNRRGPANTIVGLLQINKGRIEGVAKEFGLISKGIGEEDMISATTISSKSALEGVRQCFCGS